MPYVIKYRVCGDKWSRIDEAEQYPTLRDASAALLRIERDWRNQEIAIFEDCHGWPTEETQILQAILHGDFGLTEIATRKARGYIEAGRGLEYDSPEAAEADLRRTLAKSLRQWIEHIRADFAEAARTNYRITPSDFCHHESIALHVGSMWRIDWTALARHYIDKARQQ